MTQFEDAVFVLLPEERHDAVFETIRARIAVLFPDRRSIKVAVSQPIAGSDFDFSSNYRAMEPIWEGPRAARISLAALQILQEYRPAVAVFPLDGGAAYFSCQHRVLGTGLDHTKIVVIDAETRFETLQSQSLLPSTLADLVVETMEQDIRAKADLLVAPSATPPRVFSPSGGAEVESIGVAIAHYARPALLRRALRSLAAQTRLPDAVVVTDDGSPAPFAADLDAIEAMPWPFPLTLLRRSNAYLGAARNAAWRRLETSHVLFMDDDNIALPKEIETFEQAAQRSGADLLTAHMDYFENEADLAPGYQRQRWLPLGGHLELAAFVNLVGDANFFVRKTVLEDIGGFSEDRVGYEDWEFLLAALLSDYRIEVIPEVLYHYHRSDTGMLRSAETYRSLMRAGRQLSLRHPQLDKLYLMARGMLYRTLSPNLDTADLWRSGRGRE